MFKRKATVEEVNLLWNELDKLTDVVKKQNEFIEELAKDITRVGDNVVDDFLILGNRLSLIDNVKDCPICHVKPLKLMVKRFLPKHSQDTGLTTSHLLVCPTCRKLSMGGSVPEVIAQWNDSVTGYQKFSKK